MAEIKQKEREYKVVIKYKVSSETIERGIEIAKQSLKFIGLNVISVKPISTIRSENQNNALHLWLDQIAEFAEKNNMTVDKWILHPTEMNITSAMLKDSFRATAKIMYRKNSTADLTKLEFSEVVKLFDKAVLERLGIDIPFPNLDLLIDRDLNQNNNK
jgi:hypothetical protein